jgi:hypothetical protein
MRAEPPSAEISTLKSQISNKLPNSNEENSKGASSYHDLPVFLFLPLNLGLVWDLDFGF